ncbi:hypothetical protein [Paraburkholderia sabiae]|uniref:hypothetical protein n=1 Tax=Paraburkholderia sabiae TaxID=273251 RepID=UPI001CC5EBBB|nr:hypothetical protein [Paraburkholderia sabiae]
MKIRVQLARRALLRWQRTALRQSRHAGEFMAVAEIARLLNVSRGYVVEKLLHSHVLGPVVILGGQRYVLRSKVGAYHRKRQTIARRALRELGRVTQEAGAQR